MTGLEDLLPDPHDIEASAPDIEREGEINKIAVRRAKVRELMRMGYEAHQIALVIEKGIKMGGGEVLQVPSSVAAIRNDMDYIRQEDTAVSADLPEKRAEILDKLKFLYNQSIRQYIVSKGAIKNSFLNTALSVLNKWVDLEGLSSPESLEINVSAEAKVAKFAAEVHQLSEEDRNALIATIRQILGKRKSEGAGDAGFSSESPAIPAQTGDNEGVPRESGVRKRARQAKAEKQGNTS